MPAGAQAVRRAQGRDQKSRSQSCPGVSWRPHLIPNFMTWKDCACTRRRHGPMDQDYSVPLQQQQSGVVNEQTLEHLAESTSIHPLPPRISEGTSPSWMKKSLRFSLTSPHAAYSRWHVTAKFQPTQLVVARAIHGASASVGRSRQAGSGHSQ